MSKIYTRQEILGEGKRLDLETVQQQIKFLQGKVLTIIEATIIDKSQLKAIKSIVNNDFGNQLMYVYRLCYPEVEMLTQDQADNLREVLDLKKDGVDVTKLK